jgi:hypothetical protein
MTHRELDPIIKDFELPEDCVVPTDTDVIVLEDPLNIGDIAIMIEEILIGSSRISTSAFLTSSFQRIISFPRTLT